MRCGKTRLPPNLSGSGTGGVTARLKPRLLILSTVRMLILPGAGNEQNTQRLCRGESRCSIVARSDEGQQISHLLNADLPVKIGGHGREVRSVHPLDVRTGNHSLLSFFLS